MIELKELTGRISEEQLETGFALFLMLWVGYLLYESLDWRIEDNGLPLLIGGITFVLLAIHLVAIRHPDFYESVLPERDEDDDDNLANIKAMMSGDDDDQEREMSGVTVGIWAVAVTPLLFYFGMYYVLPLFVFGSVWYFLRDLKLAILTLIVFCLFLFGLFVELLDMPLWEGDFFR